MTEDLVRNLIRSLGTIIVLAAVYFFLVKPILDTTTDTVNRAFDASDEITERVFNGLEDAGINQSKVKGLNLDSGDLNNADINPADIGVLTSEEAEKIFACMDAAESDVTALAACGQLAQKLSGN